MQSQDSAAAPPASYLPTAAAGPSATEEDVSLHLDTPAREIVCLIGQTESHAYTNVGVGCATKWCIGIAI